MRTPLHKQISDDLRKKIISGHYKENDIIPRELDLADTYKVSRPTIRRALLTLEDEGYVKRIRKKGTIIKTRKITQDFIHVIESYNSQIQREGFSPKTKVLYFKKQKSSEIVSENLKLKKNSDVYKLVRLRYIDNEPLVLVTTFIPAEFLPDFLEIDFEKESLYNILSKSGFTISKVSRNLEVSVADETASALLNIRQNDPIFYFETVGKTKVDLPMEYSILKYRGDLNKFIIEIEHST